MYSKLPVKESQSSVNFKRHSTQQLGHTSRRCAYNRYMSGQESSQVCVLLKVVCVPFAIEVCPDLMLAGFEFRGTRGQRKEADRGAVGGDERPRAQRRAEERHCTAATQGKEGRQCRPELELGLKRETAAGSSCRRRVKHLRLADRTARRRGRRRKGVRAQALGL